VGLVLKEQTISQLKKLILGGHFAASSNVAITFPQLCHQLLPERNKPKNLVSHEYLVNCWTFVAREWSAFFEEVNGDNDFCC